MMETVMGSWLSGSLSHLMILAYHDDRLREGEALALVLLDLKTVLMPRQWFFNKLATLRPHCSSTAEPDGTSHD